MKKRWIKILSIVMALIILISVAALVFVSCSFPWNLSREKKREIRDAWLEKTGEDIVWYHKNYNLPTGMRYYGTYSGYTVFFKRDNTMESEDVILTVAGQEIKYGFPFTIWAYKDGEFYGLEYAYNNGLLSRGQIRAIAKYHEKFEEYVFEEYTSKPLC